MAAVDSWAKANLWAVVWESSRSWTQRNPVMGPGVTGCDVAIPPVRRCISVLFNSQSYCTILYIVLSYCILFVYSCIISIDFLMMKKGKNIWENRSLDGWPGFPKARPTVRQGMGPTRFRCCGSVGSTVGQQRVVGGCGGVHEKNHVNDVFVYICFFLCVCSFKTSS